MLGVLGTSQTNNKSGVAGRRNFEARQQYILGTGCPQKTHMTFRPQTSAHFMRLAGAPGYHISLSAFRNGASVRRFAHIKTSSGK
jgi:hypothetical protein